MHDENVIPLRRPKVTASPQKPTEESKNSEISANTIDVLTSYVRDTEHEILAVVTALQAHIDLLHAEQVQQNMPVARFDVLHRSVARIVQDTLALASVSELAKARLSKKSILMLGVVKGVITDSQWKLKQNRISVACNIPKSQSLIADADPIKLLFSAMLMTAISNCQKGEKISIGSSTEKNQIVFSFDIAVPDHEAIFEPWRLGELRLVSTHGQGIELAAIDAMARMQGGCLSVCTRLDKYSAYRLTFAA